MLAALENNPLRLLKRCTCLESFKQIHALIILTGIQDDNYVAVKLVSFCTGTLRDVGYARMIFNTLADSANVFLWTAMIASYSGQPSSRAPREAISMYKMLRRRHWPRPNEFTLSSVLKACSLSNATGEGVQIHTDAVKFGLDSNAYVQAALLDMYSKLGLAAEARELFKSISPGNVVASNTMLSFCSKSGDVGFAREIFDSMPTRDFISWSIMISGYAGQGNMAAARLLFDTMPEKEINAWNALIAGCTYNGQWREAIGLFFGMRSDGVEPNHVTMSVLMSACGHFGAVRFSSQVHGFLEKICVKMNVYVLNSLVDMYAKCGCIRDAHRVFRSIPVRDVVSYNVMIGGFAYHGCVEDCLKLFAEMLKEGTTQPDAATFLGVLTACSHAGLLRIGCKFFEDMSRSYGVRPTADHYACVVDMFARSGFIGEAYELLKTIPVEPHAGVFGALLNASRTHRNIEVGSIAARELFKIDSENPGNYVLLSNIFARESRWDGVSEARNLMRDRRVEKTLGCSWIELDNSFPEFAMADSSLSLDAVVYDVLRAIYLHSA